jgi:23S rRNA pseudoU1915 N3-methylase RlmH
MTEFEGQIKELSKLIYNWNLINVASKSQLDDFSKRLLNALGKQESAEKIRQIIESELCVTFGLYSNEFNSNILAEQIMQWQDK